MRALLPFLLGYALAWGLHAAFPRTILPWWRARLRRRTVRLAKRVPR